MIEHGVKTIKVELLEPLPSGTLMPSNLMGNPMCELVAYINGVSNERDPMIRLVINKARFLHLSTIKCMHPRVVYRDKEGRDFSNEDVIDRLYN